MSVREREDAPNSDISPVPVSELDDDRTVKPVETQANKIPNSNQKEITIERGNLCDDSEILEWLQEFRENLVDDEIPLQGGSHASSSHEASLEPTTKRRDDLGKHNVYTHFPKDRNCENCKRTKITRAPCRRRNGEAVPRAANFGDLIRACCRYTRGRFESTHGGFFFVPSHTAQHSTAQHSTAQRTHEQEKRSKEDEREERSEQAWLPSRNSWFLLSFTRACFEILTSLTFRARPFFFIYLHDSNSFFGAW